MREEWVAVAKDTMIEVVSRDWLDSLWTLPNRWTSSLASYGSSSR
jgi:hypothetical protein